MIRVTRDPGLWLVTLDRAEKANALTAEMLGEIADTAISAARHDVKALVLTGAGRVFSAGADLDAARAGLATDPVWERASGAIAAAPCLTVAALNGTLAGGAFGIALACDLRIAVPGARFFYPVMKMGYLPQPSDPGRLKAIAGHGAAKRILMGGEKLDAETALRIGLIDAIADDPLALARDLCADALAAHTGHVAAIKRMIG